MYNRLNLFFAVVLFVLLALPPAHASIVTSNHPLALIAVAIAPDSVAVHSWRDKHRGLHQANMRPSQLMALQQAELVVWLGQAAEPALAQVINRNDTALVLDLSALLDRQLAPALLADGHSDHRHAVDVHVWLNPELVEIIAEHIGRAMAQQWPDQRLEIEANSQQFRRDIQRVSGEYQNQFTAMKVFALHDAYGHLAAFYGFTVIESIIDVAGNKPGAKRFHSIQQQLVAAAPACVLTQPQFSEHNIASVMGPSQVPQLELDPNATVFNIAPDSFLRYSKGIVATLQQCHRR